MVNNCLVTKLKSVVNNDKLNVLGSFVFSYKNISNRSTDQNADAYFRCSSSTTLRIIGDGYFALSYADLSIPANRKKSYTFPAGYAEIWLPENGGFDIEFKDSYNLQTLFLKNEVQGVNIEPNKLEYRQNLKSFVHYYDSLFGIDLSEFEGLSALEELNIEGSPLVTGNIASVNSSVLKVFKESGRDVEGSISSINSNIIEELILASPNITGSLSDCTRFTQLKKLNLGTGITGSISDLNTLKNTLTSLVFNDNKNFIGTTSNLAYFTKLSRLYFNGTNIEGDISELGAITSLRDVSGFLNNTAIYGTVESIITALRNAGQTGTFKFNFGDCPNVTYNGVSGPNSSVVL